MSLGSRMLGLIRSKFVRDTAVLQLGMVVTMGTYFATSVMLARGLGPTDFGRYTLAFALYTVAFFVVNMGALTTAMSRYSHACGRGDPEARLSVLASFLKVFGLMTVAILSLGLVLPAFAEWSFDDREIGRYAWLLCWLGPTQALHGLMLVVLQGSRRMREFVLYDNACGLLRVIAISFALLGFYGIEGVVLAHVIAGAVGALIALRSYRLVREELESDLAPPPLFDLLRAVPKAKVLGLLADSSLLAISKNGDQALRQATMLLMGKVSGPSDLAHFRVAYYCLWAVQQLLGGLSRSLLPALGFRLGKGGSVARFRHDLFRVGLTSGLLFIAVTGCFLLFAPFVIRVAYGAEYADSVTLVYLLAIGHLAIGFGVIADPFYIYTNQLRIAARVNLFILLGLCLPLGYLLIRAYGVFGGALFLGLTHLSVFVHIAIMLRYFRRDHPETGTGTSRPEEMRNG